MRTFLALVLVLATLPLPAEQEFVVETMDEAVIEILRLRADLAEARDRLATLQLEVLAARNRSQALEAELATRQAAEDMPERYRLLLERVNQQEFLLDRLQEAVPEAYARFAGEGQPQVAVDTTVLAVREDTQRGILVMLAIPAGAALPVGTELTLHREQRYLARVRVEELVQDMAVARVLLDSFNTEGLQLQVGDQASSGRF